MRTECVDYAFFSLCSCVRLYGIVSACEEIIRVSAMIRARYIMQRDEQLHGTAPPNERL